MTSAAPLDIRPGCRLPGTKYTVVRKMGEGGMGVVLEVEKPPAIRGAAKLLAIELCSDRSFLQRFLNEAHLLAQIEHPHIVRVYDYDVLPDGRPFFVMELLRGKALDTVLREQGPLPPRVALRVMRELLSALECAHRHATPIVHRDVKPGNVFLHKPTHGDSVVKLLDFGISSGVNKKTAMAGTHGYMAPEQLRADGVSPRTDVYAAAVTLFEVLTGHGPFPSHEQMGVASLQYATLEVPAPRLTRYVPWVPESVADAVAAALEKDPSRRPESALAFSHALDALEAIDGASIGLSDAWTPSPRPLSLSEIVEAPPATPPSHGLSPGAPAPQRQPKIDTFASHESTRERVATRWRWVAAGMLSVSAVVSVAIILLAGPSRGARNGRTPPAEATAPPTAATTIPTYTTSNTNPTPSETTSSDSVTPETSPSPSPPPSLPTSAAARPGRPIAPAPPSPATVTAPPARSAPSPGAPAPSADAIRTL